MDPRLHRANLCRLGRDIIYTEVKHTDTSMASKTISIKESTYRRLTALKGTDESFSDVIDRLVESEEGRHPLFELVGLLDAAELETVRRSSDAFRRSLDREILDLDE